MSKLLSKDGPVAEMLERLSMVPRSRIKDWIIVVQYDTGVAMIHTLCCEPHARQALLELSQAEPMVTEDNFDPEGN